MPKIEMTTTDLELSVGEARIMLNAGGIFIAGAMLAIDGGNIQLDAETELGLTSPEVTAATANMAVNGNLDVGEFLTVMNGGAVMGELFADLAVGGFSFAVSKRRQCLRRYRA